MRRNRFLTRLSSGVLVIALAAGEALLLGGVSNAAPPVATSQAMATTTTLTTLPTSSVAQGNPVTLTAAVNPAAAGMVQFQDGGANLGTPVPVSNGSASYATSALAAGSHQLTAVFTPTDPATASASTSQPVTLAVTAATVAAPTSTTLTVLPNFPCPQNVPALLRATVVPDGAAGTVQFQSGATTLGAPVPVVGGSAILITSTLAPGTHSLTAVFIPTSPATHIPSTSPAVSMTVTGPAGGALLERIVIQVHQLIQPILGG